MIDCAITREDWPLAEPFVIARETMTHVSMIVVTLVDRDGTIGRGEAAGVDYDGETASSMQAQVECVAPSLVDDFDPSMLATSMPAGGARNAIDCAFWDLRAKRTGVPAWRTAGLDPLRPLTTALTLGLCDDVTLHRRAVAARDHPVLKLKVDATRHVDRVRIVRDAHPAARLVVDANEAWTRGLLEELMPELAMAGVELIEQPLPRGDDASLDGLVRTVPIAADESCTDVASLAALRGRYDVVVIKLDKCGGLTEALRLFEAARDAGLEAMIGNMCGTSLAMAPAFLVGQRCRFVDLDGPLLQTADRPHAMRYRSGIVDPPVAELWG